MPDSSILTKIHRFLPLSLTVSAVLLVLSGCGFGSNPYYDPAKSHHGPNGFVNPPGSAPNRVQPWKFVKFIAGRMSFRGGAEILPPDHSLDRTSALAGLARSKTRDRVTWIGHATALIGLGGLNILTDPMFSDYPMPVPLGVKRYLAPGLAVPDLPPIDVIVISHSHFDSLDLPSLELLAAHSPEARVLVPLGMADLVRGTGLRNVREMDWYESETIGLVTLQLTPAIHNSQRTPFDINKILWAGFVFRTANKKIWFTGDTAIGPVFDEVRERIGAVDVALVPIGAFEPKWLMSNKHTTPEEAAELARRMGAPLAIGVHWGTFPLGTDLPKEAQSRFLKAGSADLETRLLKIGETLALSD